MSENTGDTMIDLGIPDDEADTLPTLENKYQQQMRQIITQKIELPISTVLGMIKEQIDLNPNFQRRERWNADRQSRFIESLIMNVPIPPVFLGEDEYGKYVVLDGRQRLTAVACFLRNEYPLRKLAVWKELTDLTFSDLVKRDFAKFLTRRFIPAVVILKESSPEVKYDVFDRLNTGGVVAEPMEIRNAIYRGPFTELLVTLSRSEEFCDLWGIPSDVVEAEKHPVYQKMGDLELVLRFFALSEYEKMQVKFKDFLSVVMDERNKIYRTPSEQAGIDRDRFLNAARNSWRIFGDGAFRKGPTPTRSAPLADAIMIGLANYPSDQISDEKAAAVRVQREQLFENDVFIKAITSGTNGPTAIKNRIELARTAFMTVLTA